MRLQDLGNSSLERRFAREHGKHDSAKAVEVGAAVDVLDLQGAGGSSPLIGVPGIVVTPHMAALTRESMARVAMSVTHSVIARLRGETPAHVVNPEALSVRRSEEA